MMKICIILFSALTASYGLDTIPVFLRDDGLLDDKIKPQTNPFLKIEIDEFASIVDLIQESSESIIFFIEDYFCMEDITSKDNKGTPFVYLNKAFKAEKVKPFLRVVDPYTYFKTRFPAFDFNTFYIRSTTTKLRLEENYKFMYVFFEDVANETRIQQLRRHDTIMYEVFFVVKQLAKGPVMAIYTGKINPVDTTVTDSKKVVPEAVERLPVSSTTDCKWAFVKCDGNVLFQFCGAKINDNIKSSNIHPRGCVVVDLGDTVTYYIKVNTQENPRGYQIRFKLQRIEYSEGEMWKLILLTFLNDAGRILGEKKMDVEWKRGDTYETLTPTVLQKDPSGGGLNIRLDIVKYVISINASDGGDNIRKLGRGDLIDELITSFTEGPSSSTEGPSSSTESLRTPKILRNDPDAPTATNNNTQGTSEANKDSKDSAETFITAPILMGLIVAAICITILSWGISNMMSIETNSRYDSPNSKPLFNPDTVGE